MKIYREKHGNDRTANRKYVADSVRGGLKPVGSASHGMSLASILVSLRAVFLPEGYPHSVSEDYIYYQGWDTVQAFASSISGSLATAALLEGVGVGDETATPLAASLTWLMRDGAGMLGRISFAAYTGTGLDYDCKKWRLFADVLNDFAMLTEILTPRISKSLSLPVLCLASVCRSIVGAAGGATKAAVAQHQAKQHNMADLCAKDGSQETLVNLLALCVNLWILPLVADRKEFVMFLFLGLTALHIFANYKAVRSLEFDTVNIARLNFILNQYIRENTVPSIAEANMKEPVTFSFRANPVVVGCSLQNISSPEDLQQLEETMEHGNKFFVVGTRKKDLMRVFLSSEAESKDVLEGYILARFLMDLQSEDTTKRQERIEDLLRKMKMAGWKTDRSSLATEGFHFYTDA